MMKRLGLLTTEFPPWIWGGLGRYSAELAAVAAADDWAVDVILVSAYSVPQVKAERGATPAIQVIDMRGIDLWSCPTKTMTEMVRDRIGNPQGCMWDVLYVQDPSCARLAVGLRQAGLTARLAFASHLPISSSFSYFDRPVPTTAQLQMEALLIRWADAVVSPSLYARDLLLRTHRIDPARSVVIPLGARLGTSMCREDKRGFRVAWIGRLMKQKGVDLLLRVAASLGPGELQVVGSGPMATEVDAALSQMRQPARLSSIGYDEVAELLASADVLLSTAVHETFGLTILEGMAHGAVPVVTDSGPVSEFVSDGENGVIAPHDAAVLVGALDDLRRKPELRRSLSACARRAACQHTWEGHWTRLKQVLELA